MKYSIDILKKITKEIKLDAFDMLNKKVGVIMEGHFHAPKF